MSPKIAVRTSIYTREPYYKDDAKDEDYAPTALYTYNCKDCAVTYEIFQTLDQDLMDEDGNQWIERSGSEERVCLLGEGTESSQQMQIGEPIEWVGRLTTIEDSIENSAQFCIDIRP